ncbi:MAG: glutamyl-tRNA reductase [Flavobacteriales bacterium]|nr:glutamyl-tRNA reductase [Flavobacteriales bacterium]
MENLQIIAITHKHAPLELIGKLHIDEEKRAHFLNDLKEHLQVQELAFLSTCNRVEFIFSSNSYFCKGRENQLLDFFGVEGKEKGQMLASFQSYRGEEAMRHLLEVGASLDSMVIGEREIITQVRKSFEDSREWMISGDLLRLVSKKVIETSKRIYTDTAIATKPVSVVSLAWKNFKAQNIAKDEAILLIGAGQTNGNFARFLSKEGYRNVTVANRTLERAITVAKANNWEAVQLYHIPTEKHYRAVVTCTGSEEPIVTTDFLSGLWSDQLFIIDMALPADVADDVKEDDCVRYLGMTELQAEAQRNIEVRKGELDRCKEILDEAMEDFRVILRQREIELAMREIPDLIKQIKETALGEVFSKELNQMDEASIELLHKILGYMEKKYISVPMKLAREVMLENANRN